MLSLCIQRLFPYILGGYFPYTYVEMLVTITLVFEYDLYEMISSRLDELQCARKTVDNVLCWIAVLHVFL